MYLLYNILLHISFILLLPYFLFKIIFIGKYREGISERFGFIPIGKVSSDKKRLWFHAVSVGETKAVMPLIKRLKAVMPDIDIIFSTTTSTGNEIARSYQFIDSVIYFPLDFSWAVKRVIDKIKPIAFIVVEKEVWPNILNILGRRNIPVIVVNGKVSNRSFKRYNLFRFFFKRVFKNISFFCAQRIKDYERITALGIEPERVSITGNVKFDMETSELTDDGKKSIMQALGIKTSDTVFIAGSTHRGEEEIILDAFDKLKREMQNLKLIIAPRHPERFKEVEDLIRAKGFSILKRSETLRSPLSALRSFDVILLDTMGELGMIYALASAAFVGGSFLSDVGGHNLLEPALYKKPVLFGPYIYTFSEGADILTKGGGGIMAKDRKGLEERLKQLFLHPDIAQEIGKAGYVILQANRGATEKSLAVITKMLDSR
ncbi:MAG: 3-deoxy-D-manno-octulosonic acid transferase [Deltaproteobacteria bacterium]|nr:3-deoxy-D-manno-octulosonic acid transferase [Deltaproteobacteria bacterium]